MLAVQYLEHSPNVSLISDSQARACLRAAFDRLQIDCIILGWDLPEALIQACAQETRQASAQLYSWYPLLSGSSLFDPRPEWQVVGLNGERVPGFKGLPEFTFLCPNRPDAAEAMLEQLACSLRDSRYKGVFLDRIRYPSPAVDPFRFLACFCTGCQAAADNEGLDLVDAQRRLQAWLSIPEHFHSFVTLLLDPSTNVPSDEDLKILAEFLDFRSRSISRFVRSAFNVVRNEGLTVGLDCFSPSLAYMVGQDLAALDDTSDWVKIMTYGHTHGPAGLPFELRGLIKWMVEKGSMSEVVALDCLALAAHIPLPPTLDLMAAKGLSPEALASEVVRARDSGVSTLLAGIELVELEGVTRLDDAQIAADLRAFQRAGVDGLVLSWDLHNIPHKHLDMVGEILHGSKVS